MLISFNGSSFDRIEKRATYEDWHYFLPISFVAHADHQLPQYATREEAIHRGKPIHSGSPHFCANATHSQIDSTHAPQHARGMILTEYGLHLAKVGDHWRRYHRVSGVTSRQPAGAHLNSF
jgi:hypothetical protein